MLLHGLLGSHRNLAGLAQGLADERSVLAVDLRNHGASSHHTANSIADHAADIGALLAEEAGGAAHLVGHSFGGRVAVETALRFPARVASLFLLDITPDIWSENRVHHSQVHHILRGLVAVELNAGRPRALEQIRAVAEGDEGLFAFLRTNLIERDGGELAWRCNLSVILQSYAPNFAFKFSAGRFDGPVGLVRGSRSDFVDEAGLRVLERLFPAFNAQRHCHAVDAGHWLHGERPAEVFALVRAHLRTAETELA